ncbi:MAG: CoA transferase [Xanthomonadaceae bacterium]|nr:CoA transferase [Xanthomonadaceae bacterium]MDP2186026.1 CoA transferase [Xanthomonadales bacterium]MDZ4117616.1 CoA transferase [Xanthomonadaceae bacterium]MDZ4377548.1 CoA transferase [Xanthomonadaceae bacterium]
MTPSLHGITVLELSRVLAGPWCGMTLADLGADVIKLEPFGGDDTRGLGPPFRDGMSAYFACCNRNKRSLAIDLRAPGAAAVIATLAAHADVVIENYRTGTAENLGVGYEQLAAINPRIIYCSISGYGRSGIGAQWPGYDFVVQAEAGLMAITGPADGEPSKVGVALVDLMTGQNAVIAILAALRAREHSGLGQRIDVSLFDTQLQSLSNVASSVCFTGEDARRYGNAHASIVPYQSFHASDGDFVLAVASDKLWQQLCETLAQPQWLTDPQFCDNAARVLNRDVVCAALAELFSAQPVQYWLDAMANAGVPAARVNTVKQALEHPVAHDRDMRIAIDGIPLIGSPLKLSGTPVRYQRPPPTLGEHTNEVLAELGLDATALRSDGIVR